MSGATTLIYAVGIGIFSLAFIFMFMLLKPSKVTREKLQKVLGEDVVEKIKKAKDNEEIQKIIMSLKKSKKIKLKTLAESQNLIDALKLINELLLDGKNMANLEKVKEVFDGRFEEIKAKTISEIEKEIKNLPKDKRAKLQLHLLSMDDKELAQKIKELT